MIRRLAIALAALTATGAALAQTLPPERATGPISVATNAQLAPTLRNLAAAYARALPGQHIRIDVAGSDVAMARLSTGRSDMAIIGRGAFEQELKGYEWIHRTPPKATTVFHGSINNPGHTASLAVLVHASNPIKSITPAQLTEAFRLGGTAPTWRALGVQGPLASQAIHLVIHNAESGTGRYMRSAMLDNEVQFDWRRVTEVTDPVDPKLGLDLSGSGIAAHVARNPAALGIGDARAVRGVRVVPVLIDGVALKSGDAGYRYDRDVMAYSDPKPRPGAGAFLDWLRTPAASAIIKQGRYRPLENAR